MKVVFRQKMLVLLKLIIQGQYVIYQLMVQKFFYQIKTAPENDVVSIEDYLDVIEKRDFEKQLKI